MSDDLIIIIQQAFNGTSIGLLYALFAIGITLVFGLTRLVNFAHGELVMIAAILTAVVAPSGGAGELLLALVVALGVVSAVSGVSEVALFRPTASSPMNGFLVSLGLILLFQGVAVELWGDQSRNSLPLFPGVFDLGGVRLAWQRLFAICVTVLLVAVLFLFLNRHRVGMAIRAMSDDREAADMMGIPTTLLTTFTFVLGGALAAAAGVIYATLFPVHPYIGEALIVKAFAVALLGGLGNPLGALIAGVTLGITEAIASSYFLTEWKDALAFLVMFIVLLIRPTGIFRGA